MLNERLCLASYISSRSSVRGVRSTESHAKKCVTTPLLISKLCLPSLKQLNVCNSLQCIFRVDCLSIRGVTARSYCWLVSVSATAATLAAVGVGQAHGFQRCSESTLISEALQNPVLHCKSRRRSNCLRCVNSRGRRCALHPSTGSLRPALTRSAASVVFTVTSAGMLTACRVLIARQFCPASLQIALLQG